MSLEQDFPLAHLDGKYMCMYFTSQGGCETPITYVRAVESPYNTRIDSCLVLILWHHFRQIQFDVLEC